MQDEILPGDLDTGDVIMLTGGKNELLVKAIQLGQGEFILTVSPADDDTPGRAARRRRYVRRMRR